MMPCEHGYYGLCPQCVREERDELRSRVAKLERERDKYKAWHDKVMAQTVYTERTRTFHGMECVYESISRPQPLKENE